MVGGLPMVLAVCLKKPLRCLAASDVLVVHAVVEQGLVVDSPVEPECGRSVLAVCLKRPLRCLVAADVLVVVPSVEPDCGRTFL